jgi:transcriptional regulator with XRE-family HTH domain
MDTLAKRLTWARERAKLTQEELAKKAGVSQGTIGNLEAGIRDTARKITSIARALDVDVNWLADGEGPAPDQVVETSTPKGREARLIAAYEDEEVLLDLYRRAGDRGKGEIIAGARVEVKKFAREQGKLGPGEAGVVPGK